MNTLNHLQKAIADYELVHQHKPTRLIISWDLRTTLAPNPDYPKYVITILVVNMVCAGRFIHRVMLKEMVRTQ